MRHEYSCWKVDLEENITHNYYNLESYDIIFHELSRKRTCRLVDKKIIICIILTKMVSHTFCRISGYKPISSNKNAYLRHGGRRGSLQS
jgi:hypothetical protein